MASQSVYPADHGRINDEAMLVARALVEDHINHYGMLPCPDLLKDAIAKVLRNAVKVTEARCLIQAENKST